MRVIVDTDLNYPSDDYQALLLLLFDPRVHVEACCATTGNTWSEEVCFHLERAFATAGLGDQAPGIFLGASASRLRNLRDWALKQKNANAVPFTGAYEKSALPRLLPQQRERIGRFPGLEALAKLVQNASRPLDLLCFGPLSNVAELISRPELSAKVRKIHVMGGYFENGGLRPHRADFNFWFDVHAALRVLTSGIDIRLVPYDACRLAPCDDKLIARIGKLSSRLAGLFFPDLLGMVKQHGTNMVMCDQIAALVYLAPQLVTSVVRARVDIDASYTSRHGFSRLGPGESTVEILRQIDGRVAHELLMEKLEANLSPVGA